jgi:hypothetical protein
MQVVETTMRFGNVIVAGTNGRRHISGAMCSN